MSKKMIFIILVAPCVVGATILVKMTLANRAASLTGGTQTALPGQFSKITLGMNESQVLALVGPAPSKHIYPRFEHKTQAQWAELQKQVDAKTASALTDSIDPAEAKAEAQLTHQYHDVWRYQPVKTTYMTLYFNEDGTLLRTGLNGVPQNIPQKH